MFFFFFVKLLKSVDFFFFFKQKTAYEILRWLEFRRVLFRSAVRHDGRDDRGRRDDPHAQPRGLPGARRAPLHPPSNGRGIRADLPPCAGARGRVTGLHVVVASHYRLPVSGYGGTERVVVALVRGLAVLGHRVTLLAAPGTRIPEATVIQVPPQQLTNPNIDLGSLVPRDADMLHIFFPVMRAPSHPFVQTLEGNLRAGAAVPPNNIFVSRAHARRSGSDVFVYNGLDPADFLFRSAKDDYHLFLGRLQSAKGYRWAIEGAKRRGHRLLLAGGWRPSFARNITYVGEVAGRRKAELLAGAKCLWMPALWDEPFGLTTIEALFSGTR